MSNPEHIEILKQGAKAWNKWRDENPKLEPDLKAADLMEVDLRKANLRYADLGFAELYLANLSGADLRSADLSYANLIEANLSNSNLSWAHLTSTDLSSANLCGANLNEADLAYTNFLGTQFDGTNFSGAEIMGTIFGNNDLSVAKGIATVKHYGPATIGIDTIYRSKGNIPEVFLRGCGVPDDFIALTRSLTEVGKNLQYYSCFISYSGKDQKFADKLYVDLQNSGVRCWFAPEDLRIGDKIRVRIDESIEGHDKLLVILSKNSIESEWVEKEVETAMERERTQKRIILFPVKLDDEVMNVPSGWAADIRRTRNVGDFHKWRKSELYQKALEKLLRDLKAEV
jgi:uncharacterized protein YjbI with pentapeptide repeats